MKNKKGFYKLSLIRNIISTAFLTFSHFTYAITISDNNIYDNNFNFQDISIIGPNRPTLNGTITNSFVDIDAASQPTFNGNIDTGFLTIYSTSPSIFNADVTAHGAIIHINPGAQAYFNKPVKSGIINLHQDTKTLFNDSLTIIRDGGVVLEDDMVRISDKAIANFGENVTIDAKILPYDFDLNSLAANYGTLNFTGNASILKDIGSNNAPLEEVIFSNSDEIFKNIILSKNMYAEAIYFNKSNIKLLENISFVAGKNNLQIDNSIIDLNTNKLELLGSVKLNGEITFKTDFVGTNSNDTGGQIVIINPGSTFDFSNANSVKIILTAASSLPLNGNTYSYKLFVTENNDVITPAQNIEFISNETNRLITWQFDKNTYTLTSKTTLAPIVEDIVKTPGTTQVVIDMAQAISNPNVTGPAQQVQSNLGNMIIPQSIDALQRLDPLKEATDVLVNVLDDTLNNTTERIAAQILPNKFADAGISGISAGDSIHMYGIWISPFYGGIWQDVKSYTTKYKAIVHGVTIGFDTLFNDDFLVGAAVTPVKINTKYAGLKANDKSDISSLIFSIYWYKEFNNNWFIENVLCGGNNKIITKEKRIISAQLNEDANSTYNVKSYSGELMFGYNYKLNNTMILTPLVGFDYYWTDKVNYKETGASIQNLSVKKSSTYTALATFGAQLSMQEITKGTLAFTPELYGYISHELKNKVPTLNVYLDGLSTPLPVNIPKNNKIFYNLGGEINARTLSGIFEYGISYRTELATKYMSHLGALKLRINL